MVFPPLLHDVIRRVPGISAYPTFAEMAENTTLMQTRYPDLITVTSVGKSVQGASIDMISIGNGPLSALFVGAPHPHEVIGCAVIEYLIARLCQDASFREALPFRWHFIKAIEPDALRLNEGWFSSPGNLQRYYEQYYRPPLNQQAEYAFPFADNDWLSRHSLPENIAWQNAIRLARPDFLYSLHNSEAGGVYYVASGYPAGLAGTLKAVCHQSGLPLNTTGETELRDSQYEPGLFHFPDMKALAGIPADDYPENGSRPVGNSSAGYTAAAGTFSLFTEVPYWNSPLLDDRQLTLSGIRDVEAELTPLNAQVILLAEKALALKTCEAGSVSMNLRQTLQMHYEQFSAPATNERDADKKLSRGDKTRLSIKGRLERLSTLGLICRLTGDSRLTTECRQILAEQSAYLANTEKMTAVPVKKLCQLQIHAGLATMIALTKYRYGYQTSD